MMQTIEQFNQQAVKHNLSAGAILLWQHLFFAMHRKGQFEKVQQHTSVLMASLQVSNQGLFKMRQTLIDKGFLTISHDEHQHIYYTLMINGKVIGGKNDNQKSNDGFGDIILTNRYRQYIDQFCDHFGPAVKGDLLQWVNMRVKNGWTLTLAGLDAVLHNLVELSAGDVFQMSKIVAQSVTRRWKGFFALKTKTQPSGEKLLKQERKQQKQCNYGYNNRVTQKFAPEGRDLSFLVV